MSPDDEPRDDDHPMLRSGRVRIVGAEPATPPGPPVPPDPLAVDPPGTRTDEPLVADAGGAALLPLGPDDLGVKSFEPLPDLPHWTEAPTGEVPAVLSRDPAGDGDGPDPWAAMPAPTWREEHADWEAHEDTFEPSMLARDDTRTGALDDSGESDRQPWSFDLPSGENPIGAAAPASPPGADDINAHDDQDTVVVPALRLPDATEPEAGGADPGGAEPSVDAGAAPAPSTTVAPDPVGSPAAPDSPDEQAAGPELAPPGDTGAPLGLGPNDTVAIPGLAGSPPAPAPAPTPEPRRRRDLKSNRRRGGAAAAAAVTPRPVPLSPEESGVDSARPRRAVPQAPATPPPRRVGPRARPGSGLRPPEPPVETASGRNLPAAVITGVAIGAVALIAFALGNLASIIVVTAILALAVMEAYAAFRKAGYHPATLLGLVASVSLMIATYNKGLEALPLVVVLVIAFTLLWHIVGVEKVADPVESTAATVFVFCWIGAFASFAALLLNPTLFPERHGIAFLLGAVITAVAYDVGALVVGRWIGRHPLAPTISPNKTWEGLVGGAVASVFVAVVVVHFISPWTVGKAAVLGLVVAAVSPIGDLGESLIKRGLGLKDMGRILPGHGGILDRMDGLLFVLPATYYLVKAFHLG